MRTPGTEQRKPGTARPIEPRHRFEAKKLTFRKPVAPSKNTLSEMTAGIRIDATGVVEVPDEELDYERLIEEAAAT